jgi:hypothetical protein
MYKSYWAMEFNPFVKNTKETNEGDKFNLEKYYQL